MLKECRILLKITLFCRLCTMWRFVVNQFHIQKSRHPTGFVCVSFCCAILTDIFFYLHYHFSNRTVLDFNHTITMTQHQNTEYIGFCVMFCLFQSNSKSLIAKEKIAFHKFKSQTHTNRNLIEYI